MNIKIIAFSGASGDLDEALKEATAKMNDWTDEVMMTSKQFVSSRTTIVMREDTYPYVSCVITLIYDPMGLL